MVFPPQGVSFPKVLGIEEQYELKERKALSVDTTGTSYTITTVNPKVVILVCETDDMYVDIQAISTDSPKLFKKTPLTWTLNDKPTTIYAQSLTIAATLYIMVFGK
jgi:hypothetical protein